MQTRMRREFQKRFLRTSCGLWTKEGLPSSFNKVLIANRGEIACRVIRTCRELGVKTVAVYSDADANSMHVQMADEAYRIGPAAAAESYLLGDVVLDVAKRSGAQAIHPGYGFLSENADFCQKCIDAGVEFIGPPIYAITSMGSKSASKAIMEAANVPVVPGYYGDDQSIERLKSEADRMGYPLMIKAVLGGGGKGMRTVMNAAEFEQKLDQAKGEAMASFADDVVLLERFIQRSRHIEFQVFGDKHGNAVHLFERDCSVQRRNQKILEEAPGPGLTAEFRDKMGQSAVDAAKAVGYVGAGTVEFILDADTGDYFFMEMNTRLQVEHPVTEMITQQDLVQWQLHVAAGHQLPLTQDDLGINGHAIEARIYAESTQKGFLPSTGTLVHLDTPLSGDRVRVETGVRQNDEVSVFYDPMIAKLVVWGEDRTNALSNMQSALDKFRVAGLDTNIDFLKRSVVHNAFKEGEVTTAFIAENETDLMVTPQPSLELVAIASVGKSLQEGSLYKPSDNMWQNFTGFRLNSSLSTIVELEVDGEVLPVQVEYLRNGDFAVNCSLGSMTFQATQTGNGISGKMNGSKFSATLVEHSKNKFSVFTDADRYEFTLPVMEFGLVGGKKTGAISPMPGKVIELFVSCGQDVKSGDLLCLLEAMKMRHEIRSSKDGIVEEIFYEAGDFVESDQLLVMIN